MHVKLLLVASVVLFAAPYAWAGPGGVPLDLEFRIDSPPGLGQTATFTASVSVDYDLPNLSIEIEPPDGGKLLDTPAGLVASASPGEPVVLSRRVVFSKPGPKLIRAVARAEERPGVVWSCVKYVAVDVGASSGRTIAANEKMPSAVEWTTKGDGISRGRPGPAALANLSPSGSLVASTDDSSEGVVPAAEHPLVVGGRWMFYDRSGTRRGIAFAAVKLFRGSDGATLAEAETNENGSFIFPIIENPGAAGVFVRIYSVHDLYGEGEIILNVPSPSDFWSGAYGGDSDVLVLEDGTRDIGSWTISSASYGAKAWWIWDDILSVGEDMCGGWHVGDIRIYWSPTNTDGTHTDLRNWDDKSYDIYLLGGDADDTPDALLHQVGHTRRWNSSTGTICNTSFFVESSQSAALVEGWADAWVMWATNDPVRDFPGGGGVNLETPTWGDGGANGDAVRARVTGALWDMGDTADDGYDSYEFDWCSTKQLAGSWPTVQTLSEGWANWAVHWPQQDVLACLYQNTIDYNTPPVFSALPSVAMDEDDDRENVIALRSYASDAESTDEELLFAITAAPPAGMGLSIDADGCIDIHPAANWHGSAVVTVSCSDAIETLYRSFAVTVAPVNDFPKWKSLPDITTQEDTPRSNAIHLPSYASDVDDAAADLEYAIVNAGDPGCGVTLDASNYIDINPASNWYGSTSVSVQVSDPHGLAAADVFTITVTSVNDTPVISGLPNRTLAEDTSLDNTIDLWAYAADVETSDANLQFSISNNTDSRCGVSIDSKRYIDINPDADWDGVADVTIRARDSGGLYDEDTFRVTVTGTNDPPVVSVPDRMSQKGEAVNNLFYAGTYAVDPESDPDELTYQLTSLEPKAGVTLGSDGWVDIKPAAGWTGYTDITLRATDPGGLWDEDTFRLIIASIYPGVAEARNNKDGSWVGTVDKVVSAVFSDRFYVQDQWRAAGMCVQYAPGPPAGSRVRFAGTMSTAANGERRLTPLLLDTYGTLPLRPLIMRNDSLGGASPYSGTPEIPMGRPYGAYNEGLLVRTMGKVVAHGAGSTFYLWDGTRVYDSSPGNPWLLADSVAFGYRPPLGTFVKVTGVSSVTLVGGKTVRQLLPRSAADIEHVAP